MGGCCVNVVIYSLIVFIRNIQKSLSHAFEFRYVAFFIEIDTTNWEKNVYRTGKNCLS